MYSHKLETKRIKSISKSWTKKKQYGCIALSDIQRKETSAIFGKAQHPASPFAQIYQRTHMSGMPAVVRTLTVPYSSIYSQQQQAIGSQQQRPARQPQQI